MVIIYNNDITMMHDGGNIGTPFIEQGSKAGCFNVPPEMGKLVYNCSNKSNPPKR